jgi:phosphoglycerate dehydrogenase-like enzyme
MVQHKGSSLLHEHEWNHLQRLVDYLDVVRTPHAGAASQDLLQRDFKKFYTQYDQRRNKNFAATFPNLKEWYESISV